MQRHSSIHLLWVVLLTLVLVNGWFALALIVPSQAQAACIQACAHPNSIAGTMQQDTTNTPTVMPTASPTNTPTVMAIASPTDTLPIKGSGMPCLSVQVGDTISQCILNRSSVTLTVASLSQVTFMGHNWPQGQGTLTLCPVTRNDTCQNTMPQYPMLSINQTGAFTQPVTSLMFSSYTVVFHDTGKDTTQDVGITVTFTQGIPFALSASLGVAVLSLLVFVVGGGLRLGGRQPAGQGIQG